MTGLVGLGPGLDGWGSGIPFGIGVGWVGLGTGRTKGVHVLLLGKQVVGPNAFDDGRRTGDPGGLGLE
jgi:hypothetical protein